MAESPPNDRLARGAAIVELLGSRDFGPFFLGNLLSNTGTWFQTFAQTILVYRLTHSVFLLGVVNFAAFAAIFVLAPWTGSAADRLDRRRLLIATQLGALLVTGALALLSGTGHASASLVILLALVLGVTSAFSAPAIPALVPSLVTRERLPTAIALNSLTFTLARAIGPVLGAIVIARLGVTWAFGLNSASYIALIGGLAVIRPRAPAGPRPVKPRLRESVALVRRDRRMLVPIVVVGAVALSSDPATTLGPAFAAKLFHHPDTLAGYIVGAFGSGAALAAVVIGLRSGRRLLPISASLLLLGGGIAAFAWSPGIVAALAALVVGGFGYLATNTAATTRLQLAVDDTQRGRVMTLWSMSFVGLRPIGSLIDGAIASGAGIRAAAMIMALPTLLLGLGLAAGRPRSTEPS